LYSPLENQIIIGLGSLSLLGATSGSITKTAAVQLIGQTHLPSIFYKYQWLTLYQNQGVVWNHIKHQIINNHTIVNWLYR